MIKSVIYLTLKKEFCHFFSEAIAAGNASIAVIPVQITAWKDRDQE